MLYESIFIPCHLAARKWPASWKATTPATEANDSNTFTGMWMLLTLLTRSDNSSGEGKACRDDDDDDTDGLRRIVADCL